MKGFDSTQDMTPYGQQIVDAGYKWVGRYYDSLRVSVKTKLTRAEALHLSSMGLYLVSVFENANDHAGYFSAEQGVRDGVNAFAYASVIGQPVATPVYFTVDFDCGTDAFEKNVVPYFQAVRSSRQQYGEYFVGVYGSGFVCRHLFELGLVHFTWLAYAPGWAENDTYTGWNLRQLPGKTFCGFSIDEDESNGDAGGFQVK